MKAILRATAILGSASVINIAIGLVSSKVTAVLLGPSGFGVMALLQAVVSLIVTVAGLGTQTGLVRLIGGAISTDNSDHEQALRRAAWLMIVATGAVAIVLMVVFRRRLSEAALGTASLNTWILFIAPGVMFSLMAGIQSAILNARQRIGDLARISVLSAALSLVPTVTLVWLVRENGVAPAVCANLLILWLVTSFYYKRATASDPSAAIRPSWVKVRSAARELLAFGIPYLASMLVGTGVLTLVPILVLHALGPSEVGHLRAASAIAVGYIGVLLTAMAQDYLPRLSRVSTEPAILSAIVNEQLKLVLLVGGPLILAMTAAAPSLMPLLYSQRFTAAAGLLEWQLMGDLFKFAAWTMSYVIMSHLGARKLFVTEGLAGCVLLASSWFGMKTWGLPGLGIAFLATAAFGALVSWIMLWRTINLTWKRQNIVLFLLLAGALALVRALSIFGFDGLKTVVAAALAMAFGGYSVATISREVGTPGWLRALGDRK